METVVAKELAVNFILKYHLLLFFLLSMLDCVDSILHKLIGVTGHSVL